MLARNADPSVLAEWNAAQNRMLGYPLGPGVHGPGRCTVVESWDGVGEPPAGWSAYHTTFEDLATGLQAVYVDAAVTTESIAAADISAADKDSLAAMLVAAAPQAAVRGADPKVGDL